MPLRVLLLLLLLLLSPPSSSSLLVMLVLSLSMQSSLLLVPSAKPSRTPSQGLASQLRYSPSRSPSYCFCDAV